MIGEYEAAPGDGIRIVCKFFEWYANMGFLIIGQNDFFK